jgi:hypothetical protein
MKALGKSGAANHQNGFLFEDLADEEVLVRSIGENSLRESLFVGVVVKDDAIFKGNEFTGIGCQKLRLGGVKQGFLSIEVFETIDRNMGCDVCMSGNRHRVECDDNVILIIVIFGMDGG